MRKNIIIGIVVIVAIFAAYKLLSGGADPSSKDMWVDNKVSASFQEGVISETKSDCPRLAEIFIDASGSMKPYFRANDKDMINTLSEIKNLNVDGTEIYFIGNDKPYNGLVKDIIGAVENQPNSAETTFHDFFAKAACRIDTVSRNELIYFVTDGIMSVGNGDMSKALTELKGKITHSLSGHENLAAAIFRYEGGYKGNYWNSSNQEITSKECPLLKEEITRPYYVIALGRKEAIRWLHSLPLSKLNNPKSLYLGIHDMQGHKKATLAYGDSAAIQDMNKDVKLVLELPECLRYIDANQVKVYNAGNDLNISVAKDGTTLSALITPTTSLRPESDGRIKISFISKNEIPSEWISTWSTEEDLKGPDESSTYGLKYLIEGMYNALDVSENILETDFIYRRQ